ncbi:hypothetical protein MNODULE_23985 [Nitrospiraceae bacterium HYJII51-Mn-bac16s-1-B09]|uniref:Uncharacterized protein n=1 Tax=Candidatus Manganitrophus noduliformans TaxID=2606439 RepID=A0A7X6DV08_9BACT|nr:hypothetical protein [Candidatus Manganitrophus noduliformans]
MEISVKCYLDDQGEETPTAFFMGDRRIEVVEVLDRWLAPDHRYFKVEGDDGALYILRHEVVSDKWVLTLFKQQGRKT